jgi:hypothetical protein
VFKVYAKHTFWCQLELLYLNKECAHDFGDIIISKLHCFCHYNYALCLGLNDLS